MPTTISGAATWRESPLVYAGALLGISFHPWQATWVLCQSPVKVGCMGRSFGKTFAEAASALWFADAHDGTEQLIVAPTADQARLIMAEAVSMIERAHSDVQKRVDRIIASPFPVIEWKSGSTIHARSAANDGRNLRGLHPDVVRHDEAAYIPSIVITDVIPPMIAASRYRWRIYISTSWGKNHFFDLHRAGTPYVPGESDPDHASFQLPSRLNPRISASFLADERAAMTADAFSVEYEAQFSESQNAVFPLSLIESCCVPDIDPEPQPGHRYVIGYDPAKWSDRSGVVVLDVTERPWQTVTVADISGRDYLTQAGEIRAFAARYNNASVLLDATSHDQMLEQLQRDGVQVDGFKFTNESKQELINGLVIAMEHHQVVFPTHRDLIEELTYYRYEMTAAGNVRLGADARHHDDLVTALALAVQKVRQPVAFRPGDIATAINPTLTSDTELFA